jgi:hypothetical protein
MMLHHLLIGVGLGGTDFTFDGGVARLNLGLGAVFSKTQSAGHQRHGQRKSCDSFQHGLLLSRTNRSKR